MLFFLSAQKMIPDQDDPWIIARQWMALARQSEPNDPTAAAFASADRSGQPTCRMVLIKRLDKDSLHFCSHAGSIKGKALAENPQSALLMHWKSLRRQIRFEGSTLPLSAKIAADYFSERPRLSNLAARASNQSQPLDSRLSLGHALSEEIKRWPDDQPVPPPAGWCAYELCPHRIEFWADGINRLHHRVEYTRSDGSQPWQRRLLNP